jgi:dihydropyrimidinase
LNTSKVKLFDLVICNGTLIDANQSLVADLGITDGKIAAIGQSLEGKRAIEAAGKYVLPGGIDPHVHLEMPVGATRSSDDWFTGTIAAACGGTTTVIDFVEARRGESLSHALAARRELAQSKTTVDFALHMTITNDEPQTLEEIPQVVTEGCTSFKNYLTYEGFKLSDAAFLNLLEAVGKARGIVLVHAENDAIIAHLNRRFRQEKYVAPKYHALSRPPAAEVEAIQRSLALADIAGARLYVVHISTALGAEAIRVARAHGVRAFGETCPHYLLLTAQELSRPGFDGAKFVCSPPLRSRNDNDALWKALSEDALQTVGTDHCPFFYQGQKELGRESYEKIPGGLPGIESRLALLHQFGVRTGRISVNRWVQICSTNPAAIFGLLPRKGMLAPGADADVVIFDPDKEVILSRSLLHENVDYTPYEGFALQGYPVMTILRGKVIAENGNFIGRQGEGQYLSR